MTHCDLICLYFPDMLPWEREGIESVLTELSKKYRIERLDITEHHRGLLKLKERGRWNAPVVWVVSKQWREAAQFLCIRGNDVKVIFSIFGQQKRLGTLFTLFWRKMKPVLPPTARLLAHSPLNFRFYRELEGMGESQISYCHFPMLKAFEERVSSQRKMVSPDMTIGTFAPFTSESNLNYFLSVAHYVCQRKPEVKFKIFGSGVLHYHLAQMIADLEIEHFVEIVETVTLSELAMLDILLYTPLRNDHFIPLLAAAAARVPVVCSDMPGVEEFVTDGHNGFIIPVNETKPMGELVIRMLDHSPLRAAFGEQLYKNLNEKFSAQVRAEEWETLFFGERVILPKAA